MITLPFEVRNKVQFVIVGFADRPVSNVSGSQPLIFLPTKAMQNKFRKFEEIVFYDLWIPVSSSRFRFPGFKVA